MGAEREILEVDVLIVGGGPSGLAAAYHLSQQIKEHDRAVKAGEIPGPPLGELSIVLVEKAEEFGNHQVSGAVIDPKGFKELMPDFLDKGFPAGGFVQDDEVVMLSEKGRFKLPITPPFMQNHGYPIASLSRVVQWLAGEVEGLGTVDIFPGFPATEPILDETGKVIGVRTGDRGINAKGEQKPNFEPGMDIHAKATIFAEGTRGNLMKILDEKMGLQPDRYPQMYATGVKEVWQIKPEKFRPGFVSHMMGFPLSGNVYGGAFLYHLYDNQVSLGLVVGCDYADPTFDPHAEFQKLKTHPWIQEMLEGGEMLQYGAKTLPEGGWFAIPQPYMDGAVVVGDNAGFLNARRLKGIHLAVKTGMLAAETVFEALLADDFSADFLKLFKHKVDTSWVKEELYACRNFRQGFRDGKMMGMLRTGIQFALGGRDWSDHLQTHEDHKEMVRLDQVAPRTYERKYDDTLTFDRMKDVYLSGTIHEEDQPSHLKVADLNVCSDRCPEEYGTPCERFCPAGVYEMVPQDEAKPEGDVKLRINFANCVHCKTCDIMDPYGLITWTTPEGGGGPKYTMM